MTILHLNRECYNKYQGYSKLDSEFYSYRSIIDHFFSCIPQLRQLQNKNLPAFALLFRQAPQLEFVTMLPYCTQFK